MVGFCLFVHTSGPFQKVHLVECSEASLPQSPLVLQTPFSETTVVCILSPFVLSLFVLFPDLSFSTFSAYEFKSTYKEHPQNRGGTNRVFGKPCFCPLPKRGRFDENGENDEFAFYPLKARVSLLRPPKTTKMTKMAGVTREKAWFRKKPGLFFPDKRVRDAIGTFPETSGQRPPVWKSPG